MKPNLWMYYDKTTINKAASSLIIFGAEIFKRAKSIKDFDEIKEVFNEIRSSQNHPSFDIRLKISEFGFEYLTDCIRILIFFENYMKAVLITKDFCVHNIKRDYSSFKQLGKDQFKRPIALTEINDTELFQINTVDQTIHHNALLETTIGLKVLLESTQYLQHYQFEQTLLDFLRELNVYRNKLHLHIDLHYSLSRKFIENIEKVNDFVDNTIANMVKGSA